MVGLVEILWQVRTYPSLGGDGLVSVLGTCLTSPLTLISGVSNPTQARTHSTSANQSMLVFSRYPARLPVPSSTAFPFPNKPSQKREKAVTLCTGRFFASHPLPCASKGSPPIALAQAGTRPSSVRREADMSTRWAVVRIQ